MSANFHPFILPFLLGTIALFVTIGIKFARWIKGLDKKQKQVVKHTFLTVRIFPAVWQMVKEMFKEVLFHVNITKHNWRLGYMHRSIALGWFLLIVVGFVESVFHFHGHGHPFWIGVFYRYFVRENPTATARVFANIMDALLIYVLSGVLIAFIKSMYSRIVGMKKTTRLRWSDVLLRYALWAIFPLRLVSESITANLAHNGGFLTQNVGDLFNHGFAANTELIFWTAYSLALGIFFTLLPYSRYMHIFSEPILIVFRSLGVREGKIPSGYTRMELTACSRCGVCIDGCPLNFVLDNKRIQGVYLLRNIRHGMSHRRATDDCLLCNQCVNDCPVDIEINQIRLQERHKRNHKIDTQNNYRYTEQVPSFNAVGRVAYFGGCMSHLTPGIIESMKTIFETAHQPYWMMDAERTICCGRPLQQQGLFVQAEELRAKNTQMLIDSHAKILVTSCPICYQSFTKEYHLPIKVMHHTEYIDLLIKSGRLNVNQSGLKTAYHDPCELGRGCGIYDEPRDILKRISQPVKVEKERDKSICCGINLGDTVLAIEQQRQIRDAAANNLLKNHPDLIATACPMCKKAFQNATTHAVKDIAELVVENLVS